VKSKGGFAKGDFFAVLGCAVFALANLGAVSSSGRRRAKEMVCLSNLQKWGVVFQTFANNNDGYLVETLNWCETLLPYYKNKKLLLCPEATKPQWVLTPGEGQWGGKFDAWVDWDNDDVISFVGSYGINQYCSQQTGGGRTEDEMWGFVPILAVRGANHVPLLLDCARTGQTPLPQDNPPEYDGQIYFSSPSDVDEIRSFCLNRHSAAVNGVFLDFSARKIGLKELWELWWHRNWVQDQEAVGRPDFCTVTATYNGWMCNMKDFAED